MQLKIHLLWCSFYLWLSVCLYVHSKVFIWTSITKYYVINKFQHLFKLIVPTLHWNSSVNILIQQEVNTLHLASQHAREWHISELYIYIYIYILFNYFSGLYMYISSLDHVSTDAFKASPFHVGNWIDECFYFSFITG